MNKKYVFTLLSLMLFQSVFAEETHIQNMQSIAEETEVEAASNKLLETKLNNMALKQKLKAFHNDDSLTISNAPQGQANPPVAVPSKSLMPQQGYGLQQVYGLEDNLTAIIQDGNNVIPVKKGDVLDDAWKVSEINPSQVILLNTQSKTQEKKYLYLMNNPKAAL